MQKQQNGLWVLGAVLIAVILGALMYFFLISPELDRAQLAADETEFARADNELLELQIRQMQALEQQVPDWREQIAKVSLDLPPRVEQPDLIRMVTMALEESDIPVLRLDFGVPSMVDPLALTGFEPPTLVDESDVVPDGEEGGDAEPAESAEPSDGAADPTDPEPDQPAEQPQDPATVEPPFEGLYGIPVTIETAGSGLDVLDAVKRIYVQLDRFFTVTNISVTGSSGADAEPGQPALSPGDWEIQITGLVFSLIDDNRSFPPELQEEVPEYQIGGDPGNGFAPLPGSQTQTES